MKKRLSLFSFAFLAFYVLVIFAGQLPGLLHGRFSMIENSHSLQDWVRFSGDVLILYLLALGVYLLLCRYHPGKQYALLLFLLMIICATCFFCGLVWTRLLGDEPIRMSRYFRLVMVPVGAQVFFSAVFYLVRYAQYKELQQVTLQLHNRQTELSFLHSQINPHFLFNNLNNIYALVNEQNPQALPAIAGLSELLRYMLYDSSETVPLMTELSYIKKYTDLQQLRFEHPSLIEINQNCSDDNATIPPLLLIPFIENAFKHGQPDSKETWLKLEIRSDAKELNFRIANLTGIKRKDTTGGIGLHNVRQRLQLLYPGLHWLEITEADNWFTVDLQLQYGR